ncbi:hypothetical protein D3C86_2255720 [compost metagenome]
MPLKGVQRILECHLVGRDIVVISRHMHDTSTANQLGTLLQDLQQVIGANQNYGHVTFLRE